MNLISRITSAVKLLGSKQIVDVSEVKTAFGANFVRTMVVTASDGKSYLLLRIFQNEAVHEALFDAEGAQQIVEAANRYISLKNRPKIE